MRSEAEPAHNLQAVSAPPATELRGLTVVLHDMQAALREDGHAEGHDIHPDRTHAILVDHPACRVACDRDHSVVSALVEMWRKHTARPEFQQCIADTHACKCWKGGGVGRDDGADFVVIVWVVEKVKVPVAILSEDLVTII